ncbi:MAG: hypothetical protein HOK25_06575 [Rhodospirillaceae bacterium]|jgi:hypothetical protein|nr:hypothetical protein [Rhodospirillaceae bacterium]MBT5513730.1 hypothetical protein [Rhodospirillaceae bacterium]MBT6086639.1 hypothetical protein [Rhodospirillaceae bacterium]
MPKDQQPTPIADDEIVHAWQTAIDKINAVDVQLEPYPMFSIDGIFPDAFYGKILEHLPPREFYDYSKDPAYQVLGKETKRGNIYFEKPEQFDSLHEAYQTFWRKMSSPELTAALMNCFLAKLQPYLNVPAEAVRDGKTADVMGRWMLSRDLPGYDLPPHVDTRQKLISVLFYLPDEENESPYGTCFLAPKPDCDKVRYGQSRYHREDFDLLHRLKFQQNTVHAFARSDACFHSVDEVGPEITKRDLLMFNVLVA